MSTVEHVVATCPYWTKAYKLFPCQGCTSQQADQKCQQQGADWGSAVFARQSDVEIYKATMHFSGAKERFDAWFGAVIEPCGAFEGWWYPGEPNNWGGSQSCYQIFSVASGMWNDQNCNALLDWTLCESCWTGYRTTDAASICQEAPTDVPTDVPTDIPTAGPTAPPKNLTFGRDTSTVTDDVCKIGTFDCWLFAVIIITVILICFALIALVIFFCSPRKKKKQSLPLADYSMGSGGLYEKHDPMEGIALESQSQSKTNLCFEPRTVLVPMGPTESSAVLPGFL